jgi:hypothetical protein
MRNLQYQQAERKEERYYLWRDGPGAFGIMNDEEMKEKKSKLS